MTTPVEYLKAAMDNAGLLDNEERAGIAAICMGESAMFGHSETGYAHTNNDRIRLVFGSRVAGLSNAQLNGIKASDEAWFNFIYSPSNHVGKMLGNTSEGDGYRFRGRGFIQLTGRANFARYGELSGHPEIVQDPDRANDPGDRCGARRGLHRRPLGWR
jgi:predicted chitinase